MIPAPQPSASASCISASIPENASCSYRWYSRCGGPWARGRTRGGCCGERIASISSVVSWSNAPLPTGLTHRISAMELTLQPDELLDRAVLEVEAPVARAHRRDARCVVERLTALHADD